MSAEALLENPALFSNQIKDLDELAMEYTNLWEKYDGRNKKVIKPHLFKILHRGFEQYPDLRIKLGQAKGISEIKDVLRELAELRKDIDPVDKFGWYRRYWQAAQAKDTVQKKIKVE